MNTLKEVKIVKDRKKFNISVLVVDDEPEILEYMVRILNRLVENVFRSKNGMEALECYQKEKIDLIISDINMPVMDGIELLKLVRQHDRRIPFILSTGLKSLDILTEAIEQGISAFLPKPLQIKDLLSKVEDIAQNKELELKVQNEQKKLNKILNHVDSIVVMVSLSEKLLFMNQKFFDIFPYVDFDNYRQEHECICDIFEDKDGYIQSIMGDQYWIPYILEHSSHTHHVLMIDKDGYERIFSVSVQSLENNELYVVTFGDVTELQRAKDEARAAAKMKGEFLANMSHEIRTPMNGILGFTYLLAKSGLNEKQQHYIDIINGSTTTLLGIINDILDFSKLENGKLELELLPHNPIIEMNKLAQLFSARMEEKDIDFIVQVDPFITECIYIDLLRIQQVVSNLLNNALKFTPSGGEIILDVLRLEKREESLLIRIGVHDNGIGISLQQQEKIFEAFGQADSSTTRKFGGTGLGLSISAFLVGLMDSKINVESLPGKGSYFYFDIPVSVCDSSLVIPSSPRQSKSYIDEQKTKDSLKFSGKVLVAEDNSTNQMLIREYFNMYNLVADMVKNGKEAVEILDTNTYDLILMDINMPVMSGMEALRCIRKKGIQTPIVALTANAMAGDKEKFLAEGFDRYLSKPMVQEELELVLSEYLSYKSVPTCVHPFNLLNMELIQKKLPFPKPVIHKLLRSFLNNSDNSLMRLEIAIEEKDSEKIGQAAHALKGVIGNLHIEPMRKIAEEIEHQCRSDDLMGIGELYSDFEEKMRRLQQEITVILEIV